MLAGRKRYCVGAFRAIDVEARKSVRDTGILIASASVVLLGRHRGN